MKETITEKLKKLEPDPKGLKPMDFGILVLVTMLAIFGVVMVFSASYYYSLNSMGTPFHYLIRQLIFVPLGFIVLYIASKVDYHNLVHITFPLMIFSVALLIMVLAGFGTQVGGATRWIYIGPIAIMPGEFAKVAIVFFISAFIARDHTRIYSISRGILPILMVTGFFAGLIIMQPNLSTAITVSGIAFGMMFLAGIKWRYVLIAILVSAGGVSGLILFGYEHWRERMVSFMDPFANSLGEGWQVAQSLLALGTGGLFGLGLGKSVQKNLYLPEPMNDFILSIVGEELGLVGVLVLITVFMLLIWRIFKVAMRAPDRYGMLLAGGFGLMIAIQVVLNVAVVTSSMPPTGIALPFISYGGNALWICMGAIGVILNISKQTVDEAVEEAPEDKKADLKEQVLRYDG